MEELHCVLELLARVAMSTFQRECCLLQETTKDKAGSALKLSGLFKDDQNLQTDENKRELIAAIYFVYLFYLRPF